MIQGVGPTIYLTYWSLTSFKDAPWSIKRVYCVLPCPELKHLSLCQSLFYFICFEHLKAKRDSCYPGDIWHISISLFLSIFLNPPLFVFFLNYHPQLFPTAMSVKRFYNSYTHNLAWNNRIIFDKVALGCRYSSFSDPLGWLFYRSRSHRNLCTAFCASSSFQKLETQFFRGFTWLDNRMCWELSCAPITLAFTTEISSNNIISSFSVHELNADRFLMTCLISKWNTC